MSSRTCCCWSQSKSTKKSEPWACNFNKADVVKAIYTHTQSQNAPVCSAQKLSKEKVGIGSFSPIPAKHESFTNILLADPLPKPPNTVYFNTTKQSSNSWLLRRNLLTSRSAFTMMIHTYGNLQPLCLNEKKLQDRFISSSRKNFGIVLLVSLLHALSFLDLVSCCHRLRRWRPSMSLLK